MLVVVHVAVATAMVTISLLGLPLQEGKVSQAVMVFRTGIVVTVLLATFVALTSLQTTIRFKVAIDLRHLAIETWAIEQAVSNHLTAPITHTICRTPTMEVCSG